MNNQEPLSKHAVAISISESPDMAVLGLAEEHLADAMAEVARHLLAMGVRLMYGGDLRPGGFTEVLFELVMRHRRDADAGDERVGVSNFLAWPVHVSLPPEEVKQLSEDLSGAAELVYLTADGSIIPPEERQRLIPRPATNDEWETGLTAMRDVMTRESDARINPYFCSAGSVGARATSPRISGWCRWGRQRDRLGRVAAISQASRREI